MKIVHIAQYLNPGYGYQENRLPVYQQQLGHDVVLITSTRSSGFNSGNRQFPAGETSEQGFRVIRLPIAWELKDKFVQFRDLYACLEAEQPDYIFHHMPTTLSIRTISRYKKKHPDVFIAVDNHADRTISIQNRLLFHLYYRITFRFVHKIYGPSIDAYFGVTPARCLFLNEELGVPESKIRLLPIGADNDCLAQNMNRSAFLARIGLEGGLVLIAHGGKITPDKQSDRILSAFARVKDPNLRLILFGTVNDPVVEQMIRTDKRVIHMGWLNREQTLDLLMHCDLGIWNSRHTTLLEDGLAAGLPMILRYYGSTSHLLDHSGLYLYDGSVREIQDRLELVLRNPSLLASFRAAAERQRDALSYSAVASESIAYRNSLEPQPIHRQFMSQTYCDTNYDQFRNLRT
jgi:glycosyltransferase involved in cell wall biosynthesis